MAAPRKSPRAATGPLDAAGKLELYRFMLLTREFENTILRLYQQGKIVGGAYSGNGNEATAVGTAYALEATDYLFPMHRDIGAHFAKGQSLHNLMLQHLGRSASLTRGREGTGHYTDPALRIYGNISHLGAMVPVACGAALASKLRHEKNVALTYIGDGGASVGEVHEGLMMASAMKLPFILVIENNQYAYSTPLTRQSAAARLSDRAIGYGIPGVTIDGTDVLEVYRTTREAVARARGGEGPTIIEAVTMRMHGHAAHDTAWYVPKKMLEEWKMKDPVERFERSLLKEGLLTAARREELLRTITAEMDEAVAVAEHNPYPTGSDAAGGVYAE